MKSPAFPMRQCGNGVYLFGYTTMLDCSWDEWYEDLSAAETRCFDDFALSSKDFITIADPVDWCNHDYIMPVKIKGRELRQPEFDQWEILHALQFDEKAIQQILEDKYD